MLATSPSTGAHSISSQKADSTFSSRAQNDSSCKQPHSRSPLAQTSSPDRHYLPPIPRPIRRFSARSLDSFSPLAKAYRKMVDASTQYSPPHGPASPKEHIEAPTSPKAGLGLAEIENRSRDAIKNRETHRRRPSHPPVSEEPPVHNPESPLSSSQAKRQADEQDNGERSTSPNSDHSSQEILENSPVKRARPDAPAVRMMPLQYEICDTRDLVILISSMLMELIRYNDAIPLREGHLTRFHSRAPPGISVLDYLQRLTTHATLPPPILLSMVYYIDKLCALYPAFTISSLTVHRFLITSATVASKGLSDSFWTNKTYAQVGGVSIKELALLELEFLTRVEWRIVPKPEVLCDYYKSLVKRSSEYRLEQ